MTDVSWISTVDYGYNQGTALNPLNTIAAVGLVQTSLNSLQKIFCSGALETIFDDNEHIQ